MAEFLDAAGVQQLWEAAKDTLVNDISCSIATSGSQAVSGTTGTIPDASTGTDYYQASGEITIPIGSTDVTITPTKIAYVASITSYDSSTGVVKWKIKYTSSQSSVSATIKWNAGSKLTSTKNGVKTDVVHFNTINGQSIVSEDGSQDITISGGDTDLSDYLTISDASSTYATKSNGVHLVIGNTTGTAGTWTGTNSDITEYYDGLTIAFKIGIAGASTTTLNINSLGAKTVYIRAGTKLTTHYAVGTMVLLVYNATTGYFYSADYDANTVPSAYSTTAAGTAAKTATCSSYVLTANTYTQVIIANANTYAGAITLNINGKGAKSIYINNVASSSSNYTLPAGSYLTFYDGTNYYFYTDGYLYSNKTKVSVEGHTHSQYLTTTAAASTYLTKTDYINDMTLLAEDPENWIDSMADDPSGAKSEWGDFMINMGMLSESTAASTYLTKSAASTTYATKEELQSVAGGGSAVSLYKHWIHLFCGPSAEEWVRSKHVYFEILNSDSTQYTTEAQIAAALTAYGGAALCQATNANADYTDPRLVYANGSVLELEIVSSDVDYEITYNSISDTVTRIL